MHSVFESKGFPHASNGIAPMPSGTAPAPKGPTLPRTRRRGYPYKGSALDGLLAAAHPPTPQLGTSNMQSHTPFPSAVLQPLSPCPSFAPSKQARGSACAQASSTTSAPLESESAMPGHSPHSSSSSSLDAALHVDAPWMGGCAPGNVCTTETQHVQEHPLQPHDLQLNEPPRAHWALATTPSMPSIGLPGGTPGLKQHQPLMPPGRGTRPTANEKLLSRHIKACHTWRDLWCTFQECAPLFNHVHLTAVVGGMARARPGPTASVSELQEFTGCVCVYVCVCARLRACVRACVRACARSACTGASALCLHGGNQFAQVSPPLPSIHPPHP